MKNRDYDFIGFTYNGKHSIRDLGIYRVSGGDRYNETIVPAAQDKTASVEGQVGQYYFGRQIQSRTFEVPIAFDNLTEDKLRELKCWLNDGELHDLSFDEAPYKVYTAKVNGQANLQYICFNINGKRVYKGEGTINFICYYPYAHTPDKPYGSEGLEIWKCPLEYQYQGNFEGEKIYKLKVGSIVKPRLELYCGIIVEANQQIAIQNITYEDISIIEGFTVEYLLEGSEEVQQRTCTGIYAITFDKPVYIISITYALKLSFNSLDSTSPEDFPSNNISLSATFRLTVNNEQFAYTGTTKTDGSYRRLVADGSKVAEQSGTRLNDYSGLYYPTKFEWYKTSGLPLTGESNRNIGDLPMPFKVVCKLTSVPVPKQVTLSMANRLYSVTFTVSEQGTYTWDSKLGLVLFNTDNTKPTIVPATGDLLATVKPGESISINYSQNTGLPSYTAFTKIYNYWYY